MQTQTNGDTERLAVAEDSTFWGRVFLVADEEDANALREFLPAGANVLTFAEAAAAQLRDPDPLFTQDLYALLPEGGDAAQGIASRLATMARRSDVETFRAIALPDWSRGSPIGTALHHVDEDADVWFAAIINLESIPVAEFDADGEPINRKRSHTPRIQATDPWPPLRLTMLPNALPFPIHVFPHILQDFCAQVAEAHRAPLDIPGAAMLATASGAIGQSCNVKLKGTWYEPPILWIIPVVKPGFSKTPIMNQIMRPLYDHDEMLRRQTEDRVNEWTEATRTHKKDPDENPAPGPEPKQERAVVANVTVESLCRILAANPRGVLCAPDEATALMNSLNEFKKGKGSDRQSWLRLWSCSEIRVDREGGKRSIYVKHPFVSLLAGVQPDLLGSFKDDRDRDDGFIDRLLFVYPDETAWPFQGWTDAEVSEASTFAWNQTIQGLLCLGMSEDMATHRLKPWVVGFRDDAKKLFVEQLNDHAREFLDRDSPSRHAGADKKLQATAGRLALVISQTRQVADTKRRGSPAEIEVDDVRGAWELVYYFRAHLERASFTMRGGVGNGLAQHIWRHICEQKWTRFETARLAEANRRFRVDPEDLDAALNALQKAGAIRPESDIPNGSKKIGRPPSLAWLVRPES